METLTAMESIDNARRHRNGHVLEISGCEWRCLHCRHWFDAAVDANEFWCGDPCTCAAQPNTEEPA